MIANKPTIIVTGSSGLIGSAAVQRLGLEYNVVGFDRVGPPYPPMEAECVSVDLTNEKSIERALARVRYAYGDRIACVIHLAAYYDFSGEESPLYQMLTVEGTRRLLRALQSFEVEQFLFSSTMLVHAPTTPEKPINEDWPLEPKWPYPQSKVEAEAAIRRERGDIPAVLLRIAGVYDDEGHSIPIAHQIRRIYEERLTAQVYPGELTHGQAFVHLDDVVEAMRLAAERRGQLPAELAILIGEPETLGYGELQCILGRLIHDREWETRTIPKTLAEAGAWIQDLLPFGEESFIKPWMIDMADDHYELDITRAREHLGWSPRRRLRETLPRIVAALKRDPLRWYREHKLEPPGELERANAASGRSRS